jgi:hypothetical protein
VDEAVMGVYIEMLIFDGQLFIHECGQKGIRLVGEDYSIASSLPANDIYRKYGVFK